MKVYAFTLFISAALSIPSLFGSFGSFGSIGNQIKGLKLGENLADDIGQVPKADGLAKDDGLGAIKGAAGSVTSGAKGGLSSVKVGEAVTGDITDVAKELD